MRQTAYMLLRHIVFPFKFSSEDEETVNESLSWLGWNYIAWHMRVPDKSRAPVALLWDDEHPGEAIPLASAINKSIIFAGRDPATRLARLRLELLSRKITLSPRVKRESDVTSFRSIAWTWHAAEKVVAFLKQKTDLQTRISSLLGSSKCLEIYRGTEASTPEEALAAIDQAGAKFDDNKHASLGYVLVIEADSPPFANTVDLWETVEFLRMLFAVKRVTYCVGASAPDELKYATAWIAWRKAAKSMIRKPPLEIGNLIGRGPETGVNG